MKLLIMKFSRISCHFISLRSEYFMHLLPNKMLIRHIKWRHALWLGLADAETEPYLHLPMTTPLVLTTSGVLQILRNTLPRQAVPICAGDIVKVYWLDHRQRRHLCRPLVAILRCNVWAPGKVIMYKENFRFFLDFGPSSLRRRG
jgi:hypothetical protein